MRRRQGLVLGQDNLQVPHTKKKKKGMDVKKNKQIHTYTHANAFLYKQGQLSGKIHKRYGCGCRLSVEG